MIEIQFVYINTVLNRSDFKRSKIYFAYFLHNFHDNVTYLHFDYIIIIAGNYKTGGITGNKWMTD